MSHQMMKQANEEEKGQEDHQVNQVDQELDMEERQESFNQVRIQGCKKSKII